MTIENPATRILEIFQENHRCSYLLLAPDLTIEGMDDSLGKMPAFSRTDLHQFLNQPITNLVWAFIGLEDVFQKILNQELPTFQLVNVHVVEQDQTNHYLTYTIKPQSKKQPQKGLIILVEDTTENGEIEQALVQERNQLKLYENQLSATNSKLNQISQLKSLFISMAAHDLRSPLSAVQGYTELLLDETYHLPEKERRELLQTINQQAIWLGKLIENLLDLDRLEQGKMVFEQNVYDLRDIAENSIELNQLSSNQKNITIEADHFGEKLMVQCDAQRVIQIINNLLTNAIKYSHRNSTVLVQTVGTDTMAEVNVIDKGRGLTAEQLENVFDLYYRTEDAKMSSVKGAGLGLYIVKKLVEAHGGKVSVTSQLGVGTTFSVCFARVT